jgi:hypothetical protein
MAVQIAVKAASPCKHEIMSSQKGIKRARTNQPQNGDQPPGINQLLLVSPELQGRCGKRYCDETELIPLLLSNGFVRRVRTIVVAVHPLGGANFSITLDAALPTVGEAKSEIARVQGTKDHLQELYKLAMRADGRAVREDDAEPEPLEDEKQVLTHGEILTMAVKEDALGQWHTFPAGYVTVSEVGAVATGKYNTVAMTRRRTQNWKPEDALVTSGIELTEGRHYWEVESLSGWMYVGVTRPNLDPAGDYTSRDCTDGWFMSTANGSLYGNGKHRGDMWHYRSTLGDRFGVLLDINDGSILFFKNGVQLQHGPGYAAGSVTGPVVHALQFRNDREFSARLLGDAAWPAGHVQ